MLPKINNELLPKICQNHDLLILPSLEETFGVVLIEAASQGCQIAATISGGPEEIIKKIKNGHIIYGKDKSSIYNFLKKIINTEYDSHKLIKETLKSFSAENFNKTIKI